MEIGHDTIGDGVYFVCEAGINHNGHLDLAKELIEVAADADADAVKFQTFSAGRLVTETASKAEYQSSQEESSQYDMLADLELSREDHEILLEHAEEQDITFLSTPFDHESLALLDELNLPAIKIGSGELTNLPLLRATAETGRPIVLSTGMSELSEVETAYAAIRESNPGVDLALLHCVSEYPTAVEDANLRAIRRMDEAFPVPVGFSDHTTAVEMPGLAVAAGATIVEKHFTVDRTLPGPDHEASLEPDELSQAVDVARMAAQSLGNGVKSPTDGERKNRSVVRKGLYAVESIAPGEAFTSENVGVLRPEDGIPASEYAEVIGATAAEPLDEGSPITREAVHWGDRNE